VSYRCTLLHGGMDVIRAKLVRHGARRGAVALSPEPEELARVLLGGPAERGDP
jgi:hypothetical protein